MPNPFLNLDEMRAKLDALGIPHDGWTKTPGGETRSPLLEKQKESVRRLKALLEEQIGKDKQQISDLHAAVQRLKHGGGV